MYVAVLQYRKPVGGGGVGQLPPSVITKGSTGPSPSNSPRGRMMDRSEPSLEEDRASLNSFKTCPSEPNISYLPRQVSESYAQPQPQQEAAAARPSRKESTGSRKESAGGAPKTILRTNAYAAEPRLSAREQMQQEGAPPGPPRSPSGVPLPQLVERPPSQTEFSYGSGGTLLAHQPPPPPQGAGPPTATLRRPSPATAPGQTQQQNVRFKDG